MRALAVRIPEDLDARIRVAASTQRRPLAWVVRDLLEAGLASEQAGRAAKP